MHAMRRPVPPLRRSFILRRGAARKDSGATRGVSPRYILQSHRCRSAIICPRLPASPSIGALAEQEHESITQLLSDWRGGDEAALERLTPLVYAELRRLAQRLFRSESPGHTLQPTALVNEAFEGLVRMDVSWQDRAHFFALSARLMRRILVNHANARLAAKRGGGDVRVTLEDGLATAIEGNEDVLALNEALEELTAMDERRAKVIELHYFGGLTYPEIASALDLSPSTVHEDLRTAKSWLLRRLSVGC